MIIATIDIITIIKIIEFVYEKQYARAIIYFYALYIRKCNTLVSWSVLVRCKTEGLYPLMAGICVGSFFYSATHQPGTACFARALNSTYFFPVFSLE